MPFRVISLIGSFWLIIVFLNYCLAFPPAPLLGFLSVPSFTVGKHLFDPLVNGIWLLIFLVAAYGYGSYLLKRLRTVRVSLSLLERFLFSLPLGLYAMSLAVLGGDSIGLTSHWFYGVVLLAGCAANSTVCAEYVAMFKRLRSMTSMKFLTCSVAAIPCAISLVGALAPTTQFDSLVYHLELPARYLVHGGIYAVRENLFFSFPQGMEMLFQMAMTVHGHTVASLIAWVFYPLVALALYAFCRRFQPDLNGRKKGYLSALVWLFLPHALLLSTGSFVDIALTFFVCMGLYAFFLWSQSPSSASMLVLSGILCGSACGIKYTGIVFVVYVLAVIVFTETREKVFSSMLIFSVSAGAMFLPWLIKNLVLLKNPIAPWGTRLFTHSLLTPDVAHDYFTHIAGHGASLKGIINFFLLPWNLTVHGFAFGGALDIVGPMFVLFVPCALLVGFCLFQNTENSTINKKFLLVIAFFGVVWFFTGEVLRFIFPVLPFLCIIAAGGLVAALRMARVLKITAVTVFIGAIIHNMLMVNMVMAYIEPSKVVLGGQPTEQYLGDKLNYYRGVTAATALLGKGSRVLYFGETRGYHYSGDHYTPTYHDRHPLIVSANTAPDADVMARQLIAEGFTHLFVSHFDVKRLGWEKRFTASGLSVWRAFEHTHLKSLYADQYCELYEITH